MEDRTGASGWPSPAPLPPNLGRRGAGPAGLADLTDEDRWPKSRGRAPSVIISVCAHLLLLLAMFSAWPKAPPQVEPPIVTAQLVPGPLLSPAPIPAAAPSPEPPAPQAKPTPIKIRPTPAPRIKPTLVADEEPVEEPIPELSASQVAGAATAGSGSGAGGGGGGGGGCDMIRLLQNALRRDHLVQAAAAEAHQAGAGKAVLVWNGDWVRSHGQEGKGLAAIREAILWEVGFAPEACRHQPVRGLVLLSLSDGQSSARLVVGQDSWRWSDMLRMKARYKE